MPAFIENRRGGPGGIRTLIGFKSLQTLLCLRIARPALITWKHELSKKVTRVQFPATAFTDHSQVLFDTTTCMKCIGYKGKKSTSTLKQLKHFIYGKYPDSSESLQVQ